MRAIATTLLAALAAVATCAACGSLLGIDKDYVEIEDSGVLVDAAGGADGRAPSSAAGVIVAPDGAPACPGHVCDGVCLEGTDCTSCVSGKLFCAGTHACVGACSAGGTSAGECWACQGGGAPRGSCEGEKGAFCLGVAYERCACATSDSCPGASNVCVAGKCETCGALGDMTDGKRCKGGTECAADRHRCH